MDRFNRVVIPLFLILAVLCLIPAITEPGMLVAAAAFAALAGAFRFAEFFSAISTTPAERKVLEQRLREREARQSRRT